MTQAVKGGFRDIPYMGVIYVVAEAMKLGFRNGHPQWCNLGQGQPEVGEIEGAPARHARIDIDPQEHAYGPIHGNDETRLAIADHYNRLYREGRESKYGMESVSIACGGRLMLTRAFAAFGELDLGYQIPDYTAYEDMIEVHQHRFTPVLVPAREEDGFRIPAERFDREVRERGLGAFVLSNPCNPTGTVIREEELDRYVATARDREMILILDEFYSHFIYGPDGSPGEGPISGALHVEDVERDPVLLVDGLTKSFRYPGWRVGWAVGPSWMIEVLGRAASAIDGGPSQPLQRACRAVLEPARADQETAALRRAFARKRNLMVRRLTEMGIRCCPETEGTFYCWGCLEDLPEPLDDGFGFFREALKHRVMTVPGVFFDVNPGKRRRRESPYHRWTRFSFGPPEDNVAMGLDRLGAMIRAARG